MQEIKEELHLQETKRELKEIHTQPLEKTPEEKFKEEEKVAQDILKKLQDKKINKPRWAL